MICHFDDNQVCHYVTKHTKTATSNSVAIDACDAREQSGSDERSASAYGPAGSVRRVRFVDDAVDACGASDVHDAQELLLAI